MENEEITVNDFIDTILASPEIKIFRSIYKMTKDDNAVKECIRMTVNNMSSEINSLGLTTEDVIAGLFLRINELTGEG